MALAFAWAWLPASEAASSTARMAFSITMALISALSFGLVGNPSSISVAIEAISRSLADSSISISPTFSCARGSVDSGAPRPVGTR